MFRSWRQASSIRSPLFSPDQPPLPNLRPAHASFLSLPRKLYTIPEEIESMHSHRLSRSSSLYETNAIDEWRIKSKFVEMAEATFRLNHRPQPTKVVVGFDNYDNVHKLTFFFADEQTRERDFHGNSQYIPPETALYEKYHRERTGIWILGISLYRMLTGRYPFKASNDRLMFKKMLHADFTIPYHVSDEARDLLRRMLTADATRASMDLLMFHPWLKPFCLDIPSQHRSTSPPSTPPAPLSSSSFVSLDKPSSSSKLKHSSVKKLKTKFTHFIRFLVAGPYPPPRRPYQDLMSMG
ncbi:hypothetical protein EC973_001477 [Apophysomyces ossiformis]|uniref:Protein kinase domain-containing protein n=1 Tax=Apophysomyces ossiformis TaxID=679940 RepID=A0A8H7BK96_9FUNG|nr:hypothetical protein EC973_001477 [Apophysomyces ossiformis]